MNNSYKSGLKTSKRKVLLLSTLAMASVAFADVLTTIHVVDGNTIKALDITNGDGVISTSVNTPTIMESGVSAIIAAAKEKKFVYMLNANTNKVSVYWKDAGGALTKQNLDVETGAHPVAMLLSQNQDHAYVVNRDSNTISMFSVNQDTGALTSLGSPVSTGTGPVAIDISPDGKRAFVANKTSSDLSSYIVDPATGVLTRISGSTVVGLNPVALKTLKNKDGAQFVYALNDGGSSGGSLSVFSIPEAGSTLVKTQPASFSTNGKHPSALTRLVRGDNSFLYVNNNTDVNHDSIAVFQITNAGTPSLIQSMTSDYTSSTHAASSTNVATVSTIDPRSGFLYASNPYNGTLAAYIIESATGKLASKPISVSQQTPTDTGLMYQSWDEGSSVSSEDDPTPPTIVPDYSPVVVHLSGFAGDVLEKFVITNRLFLETSG